MHAAARGDQALAQALLDAGADPLQSRTVVIGVPWLRSTLFYAGGKHPEFLAWFEPIFRGALERTGKYGWEGWVEQDGKRTPIADKATLTLQPKPFRVVFKTREGVPFRAAASDSAEFVAATDSVAVRQSILSPMKLAAMDPDDKYLVVWKLKGGVPADGMVDAGSTEWSHGADAKKATGTVLRQTKAGAEYVHEVAELSVEGTSVPLAAYTGAPIQLLLGTFPPYGDGTDFFEPRRVTLQFGRK
jgi:hypothetical protein